MARDFKKKVRGVAFTSSVIAMLAAPASGLAQGATKSDGAKAEASKGAEKPKKSLSLDTVAEAQKDPVREKLDAAIRLVKAESYAEAAVQLYDFVESEQSFREEAEYNLAKALYRLGLYHSSLYYYTSLLAKGPQSHYYASALEWCLFISRKVVGDDRVHESIARYAGTEFPKEYRDEFLFHLARFHYSRALAIESGAVAGALGETEVKETVTGGKSFKGDIFGDESAPAGDEAAPDEQPKIKKNEGGGISLDEDIFGEEEPAPKPKKQDKADKKGKGKGDKSDAKKDAKDVKDDKASKAKKAEPVDEKKATDEKFILSAKEHVESAAKLVAQVNPDSKFGAKAKFLEALVMYKSGRDNDALDAFKSVVRLTRPGQPNQDERLRELAFFQLARTHFGAKQPSYSIFYYDKVDRDSYAWLDAIYEASWAEFRLGNFEKALGNLLTLHSPFFKEEYYPESHILKAVIYYENCRYPEAKKILTEFTKRYEPVHDELAKLTERDQAPGKYYEILENLRGADVADGTSERSEILGQILQIALADRELRRLDASYREVDGELKSFAGKGGGLAQSRLASHLEGALGAVRDGLAKDAGRAVKRTLERERDAIKQLIQQSVRIDIETSRAEQERIEAKLQGAQSVTKEAQREFVEWTDDERLVWPFTGEYWRDELGTYELTLAHSCQSQSGGGE
ncbi:hypothetical protein L6R52_25015 [Myxococcota bacterium]|nr:hypothetical protein [Myxococcota bacterium]